MDAFEVLTDGSDMPLVTWTLTEGQRPWDLHDLSAKLRERGWQVPAYPDAGRHRGHDGDARRVRNGVSIDLTHLLLDDMRSAVAFLDGLSGPMPKEGTRAAAFHH